MWKVFWNGLSRLQKVLPKSVIIIICVAFIRPYLNYGYMHYAQVKNNFFHWKPKQIQYNACIVNEKAIRGTFKKLFLRNRCWIQSTLIVVQKTLQHLQELKIKILSTSESFLQIGFLQTETETRSNWLYSRLDMISLKAQLFRVQKSS